MTETGILEITNKVVKYNDMVISVSNVSSVNIKEIRPKPIPFYKIPYSKKEDPRFKKLLIIWLVAVFILFPIIHALFESKIVDVLFQLAILGYTIYVAILKIKQIFGAGKTEREWNDNQDKLWREWREFDKLRIERETEYVLEISTNSGKQNFFTNRDIVFVRYLRDEILKAMEKNNLGDVFNIYNGDVTNLTNNYNSYTNNYNNFPGLSKEDKEFLENNFNKIFELIGVEIPKGEEIEKTYKDLEKEMKSKNPNKSLIKQWGSNLVDWLKNHKDLTDLAKAGLYEMAPTVLSQVIQMLAK